MIKKILIFVLLVSQFSFAQKAQKVGYIDREYILENVPEYKTAQSKLDAKINKWNVSLNKLKSDIDNLKLTLVNEKALLTPDIIAEREEDISIKETALKEKKEAYFGTSGDLFMLRKQLVKPVQDQIFNAIQEIAKTKKYDIILDKAGNDLVMLYTNPKYDISELVLQKIVKGRKKKATEKKKSDNQIAREQKKKELKAKAEDRRTKQEKLRDRIKKQNEAKAAKREALKKANAAKRAKRIADAKARREALKNKGKKKPKTTDKTDKKENVAKEKPLIDKKEVEDKEAKSKTAVENKTEESVKKTKEELRAEKVQKLKDRAAAKKAKRDSLRNVANEKRAKKLKEIEERKKKLQESKNKNN